MYEMRARYEIVLRRGSEMNKEAKPGSVVVGRDECKNHLSLDQCVECVAHWAHCLRLTDWDIRVKFVRSIGDDTSSVGEMATYVKSNHAVLSLLDPACYPEETLPTDMERVIVHELLHLAMVPLELSLPEDAFHGRISNNMLEQFIERTASAFVRTRRSPYDIGTWEGGWREDS